MSAMESVIDMSRVLKDARDENINLILFMFFGLSAGALITFVLNRFSYVGIPYTVAVFIAGAAVSVLVDRTEFLGDLEDSIQAWEKIDPELLLYLFLPALLFGEAMNLKWHFVKAVFPQALLLAGPGVLLGAFLMGLFIYYCIPSLKWSWHLCMMFGAIVSATDPVAVVALLKDAGASPKLTILIIGESLMNDGTAMVLFTLFYDLMKGESYSASDVILFFIEETIGSPFLGIAFGLVAAYCLSKVNRPLSSIDTTVQTAITVCCAYLVFFTAQFSCHISGVLACCGAGLMLSWLAPPLFLEPQTLHNIWSFVEWVGNTLIFLLAGLIMGGTKEDSSLKPVDILYTFLLYFAMMVIRCINVAALFPALSRVGLRCSKRDAVFLSYAGLRGALAMALALIVRDEHEELGISAHMSNKFFFYIGGMATITLILNATTSQRLLIKLGLLKEDDSAMTKSLLNQAKFQIKERLSADAETLAGHNYDESFQGKLAEIDYLQFNTLLGSRQESVVDESMLSSHDFFGLSNVSNINPLQNVHGQERPLNEDVITFCRRMLLERCRVKYWDFIEDGFLPRSDSVTQALLYSIDSGLRRASFQARRDWDSLLKNMAMNPVLEWLVNFIRKHVPVTCTTLHEYGDRAETERIYFKVFALTSFIEANNYAQKKVVEMWGVGCKGSSLPREMDIVLKESEESIREAKIQLMMLDDATVTSIIRQQGARVLLSKQVKYVKEMKDEGSLDAKSADKLFEMVERDMERLNKHKYEVFKENVQRLSVFRMSSMTAKDIAQKSGDHGNSEAFRLSKLSEVGEEDFGINATLGLSDTSKPRTTENSVIQDHENEL